MKNLLTSTLALFAVSALLCASAIGQQFPANATPVLVQGVPVNGTSEVQTLTIGGTPTAGTFRITYDGHQTAAITWSATNATLLANIQTGLNNLANLADGEVTAAAGSLTAGIGTITLTFSGNRANLAVNLMTVASSLTGTSPTAAITETTPGVTASGRSSAKGRLLIDGTNGVLYQNTGTSLAPTWAKIGKMAVAVADIATADGSDAETTQTLANATKAKLNDLLAKLRTSGLLAP